MHHDFSTSKHEAMFLVTKHKISSNRLQSESSTLIMNNMVSLFYLAIISIMSFGFYAEAVVFPLSKVFESQRLEGSKDFVGDKPKQQLIRKKILYTTHEVASQESKDIKSIRDLEKFDVESFWYAKFVYYRLYSFPLYFSVMILLRCLIFSNLLYRVEANHFGQSMSYSYSYSYDTANKKDASVSTLDADLFW